MIGKSTLYFSNKDKFTLNIAHIIVSSLIVTSGVFLFITCNLALNKNVYFIANCLIYAISALEIIIRLVSILFKTKFWQSKERIYIVIAWLIIIYIVSFIILGVNFA